MFHKDLAENKLACKPMAYMVPGAGIEPAQRHAGAV